MIILNFPVIYKFYEILRTELFVALCSLICFLSLFRGIRETSNEIETGKFLPITVHFYLLVFNVNFLQMGNARQ